MVIVVDRGYTYNLFTHVVLSCSTVESWVKNKIIIEHNFNGYKEDTSTWCTRGNSGKTLIRVLFHWRILPIIGSDIERNQTLII